MALNEKQSAFCREYIVDFNATRAAIRAGYSERTAKSVGSENLTKPDIQEQISFLMDERNKRLEIDADEVLKDLVRKMSADLADMFSPEGALLAVEEWPLEWRKGLVAGLEVKQEYGEEGGQRVLKATVAKVRLADRLKIIELIGRHTNIGAWRDIKDIKVAGGLEEKLNERLRSAKARSRQARRVNPLVDKDH